ncbi:MAG: hypothetical protein DRO87_06520 [Candidatus Thorarchaeota archaeon]|nr:MAG: hypothetical protein DRO87_06520 [Candidatus Thorarchaeota archaeon]
MGGKANILGSKPAEDPIAVIERKSTTVIGDTGVKWDNRSIRAPWDQVLVLSLFGMALVFLAPLAVIGAILVALVFIAFSSSLRRYLLARALSPLRLQEVPQLDVTYKEVEGTLQCRGVGPIRYIRGVDLERAGPILSGDLGRFIRGVDTQFGIMIAVSLQRENPKRVVEDGVLSEGIVNYLQEKSGEGMRSYFDVRGGVWKSGVRVIGLSHDPAHLSLFESQVKGALPMRDFKRAQSDDLGRVLSELSASSVSLSFNATGRELAEWLVQLPSELASEVGTNVPGEFVSPIRSNVFDIAIGVAVNPETLREGPPVGIQFSDLESGLMVCGGDWDRRVDVLAVLARGLLDQGKRVLFITPREEGLRLAGLDESGIAMVLGKHFILNPVDSEGVPRHEYVSRLLLALETLAGTNLSSAADFEISLNRVVALGNATVADITSIDELVPNDDDQRRPESKSRASSLAFDAVKRLHEGSGAQAFYGSQTVPTEKLAKHRLAVIQVNLGAADLESFAMQLLFLKLSGLPRDDDLVVVFDSPLNLDFGASQMRKQQLLALRSVQALMRRGPLVVSINSPSSIPYETIDAFGSCIARRMRDTRDIAAVTDLLSLTVVGGGIHSKKRVSSREGSFLRVMDPGYALMSHSEFKTCVPVRLDYAPELGDVNSEQLFSDLGSTGSGPAQARTLLETLGGRDVETMANVLRLLTKYEPLTEESVRQFMRSRGDPDADIEAILARLEKASMILRGHESHGGVSYTNYRITMKGSMALRQTEEVSQE